MGDNLKEVTERGRDIFLFRAPPLWRFGEPVLKAVDAVTRYAYRQGRQAGHEEHQDEHHHGISSNRFGAAMVDNKGLVSNLLTLALSSTAASGAAVTLGPLVPPLLGWGIVLLVLFVLLLRALWTGAK